MAIYFYFLFKTKDSEIVPYPLCPGDLSKYFSPAIQMKKDKMDIFMNLVLTIMLLQLII